MKREGKELRVLPDGDRRRLSDGRNAWRKMSREQRIEFIRFQWDSTPPEEWAAMVREASFK